MRMRSLHAWDVTPAEAVKLQRQLAASVVREGMLHAKDVRLIAGVDVSSSKDDPLLTAGIVVWDRVSGSIVESVSAREPEAFAYVPGLLSFREIPALLKAAQKLQGMPDVWMVDGQGIAHPRRLGIASHLGLFLDVPTIGVAKSILCGSGEIPATVKGSTSPLMHQGEHIGMIVRTRDGVSPVYVSLGHKIDLASAVALTLDAVRGYRLPEPTRLAHQWVNEVRKSVMASATLFA